MTAAALRARGLVATLALLLPLAVVVGLVQRADAIATGEGRYVWSETVDRGDSFRLVVGTASGGVEQVLEPHVYGRAAWSPDGTRIVYSAPNGVASLGRWALYVVNADGTGRRQVTAPLVGDFDPAWSPDGRSVAVSRDVRGCFDPFCRELWIIGLEGQGDRAVPGGTSAYQPAWSPDGSEIAYRAPDGIRAVPVGGGASRVVVQGAFSWPAWSPDGAQLAVVRRVGPSAGTVSVVPRAGGSYGDTAGGVGGGLPEAPTWADDRTLVHLNVWGEGENARTRAEVRQTVVGGDTTAVWSSGRPMYYLDWTAGWRAGLPQAAARTIDDACPDDVIAEDGFSDVPEGVHEPAVDCVVHWGVVRGVGGDRYAPALAVRRDQMATFLVGLIERSGGALPEADDVRDAFADDDGSVHEDAINRLAAVGVVQGSGGAYAPASHVTRAQMATFLVRAHDERAEQAGQDPLAAGEDWFYDDATSVHHDAINRAAQAGITAGSGRGRYEPAALVARDQMASFVARVLDLLVEAGAGEVPAEPAPR